MTFSRLLDIKGHNALDTFYITCHTLGTSHDDCGVQTRRKPLYFRLSAVYAVRNILVPSIDAEHLDLRLILVYH